MRVVPALLLAAIQAPDTVGAVEVPDEAPPLMGIEAQIIFYAFLVVILIVPWLLARESARADRRSDPSTDDGSALPVLTSERERRLWLWALAVIVAIYATLSPAQELAAWLRARNLLGVSTGAFLVLVAAVIAVRWWRTSPGRREIGAALGVLAVYVVTVIRLPVPEARSHLFEYGLLAMLVYHALIERRRNGRRVPVPPVTAFAATALLGWIDEGIQVFLPNRVYDLVDVGLNAAFALMAIVATLVVTWARRLDLLKRLGRGAG